MADEDEIRRLIAQMQREKEDLDRKDRQSYIPEEYRRAQAEAEVRRAFGEKRRKGPQPMPYIKGESDGPAIKNMPYRRGSDDGPYIKNL